MKLTLGSWYHHGVESSAMGIASVMADETYEDSEGTTHSLFNRARFNNRANGNLSFCTPRVERNADGHVILGKPIINGDVRFRCMNPGSPSPEVVPVPLEEHLPEHEMEIPDFGPSQYEITATLFVNPSRAFNQFNNFDALEVTRGGDWPAIPFFTTRDARHTSFETTLDGKDNAIILPRLHVASRPPYWQHFLRLFLRDVDRFIADRINAQSRHYIVDGFNTHRSAYYSLHEIEIYFEFQHDDPVGYMLRAGSAIRSIGRLEGLRDYQTVQDEGVNAPTYQVELAKGIILAIYAKTTRRLRLEVRYKTRQVTGRLRGGVSKSFTAHNLSELNNVVEKYTNDATARVNAVLDTLASATDAPRLGYSVQQLIRQVVEACDDQYITKALNGEDDDDISPSVRRMRNSNHPWRRWSRDAESAILPALVLLNVYQVSDGDPFLAIITRLKKRGVVVSVGRRRYSFAPQYQAARTALAALYEADSSE
ncbi:hypothetical protein ACMA5I_05120 [Paracoccaceae bacterium GXU_MW_L88]